MLKKQSQVTGRKTPIWCPLVFVPAEWESGTWTIGQRDSWRNCQRPTEDLQGQNPSRPWLTTPIKNEEITIRKPCGCPWKHDPHRMHHQLQRDCQDCWLQIRPPNGIGWWFECGWWFQGWFNGCRQGTRFPIVQAVSTKDADTSGQGMNSPADFVFKPTILSSLNPVYKNVLYIKYILLV